jgi:hypothetical protein
MLRNSAGNFSFLKGGGAYSAGVVADDGYVVEHVRFTRPVPWKTALDRAGAHLKTAGRPASALCAVELRSPKPFTFPGFAEFNQPYREALEGMGLMVDGVNPIARTNVAPETDPPAEPCLYAFAYTAPAAGARRSFVVSGAGEIDSPNPEDVVRRGETSADAMAEKARFVMGMIDGRVNGLGVTWQDVTVTNVYTVHSIDPLVRSEILPRIGGAALHGVIWYNTRPPVETIEFEVDVRGGTRESYLSS